jgi:hypothetical protein
LEDPILKNEMTGKPLRIRRTWYRRRQRRRHILLAVVVGIFVSAVCLWNAATYLSSTKGRGLEKSQQSMWVRANKQQKFQFQSERPTKPSKAIARIPGIYPYSIVPGGLKDVSDLRYATMRDYVIRQHYKHFNFANAQLLRTTEAREVYLSYRIRNTVFWTRKKVRLYPGELLLTDGKITARARCGNQISDTAKPEVSAEEPDEDVLDQPVLVAAAEPPFFPARPLLGPADLPNILPGRPDGPFTGGFIFPYAPLGVPLPTGCRVGEPVSHCHHKPKPVVTPEPSTMLLLSSGLALIFWRYRKTIPTRQSIA